MARQDLKHTATEIVHGADDPRPCEVLGFCTYAAPDGLEFGIGWKAQIDEGGTVEDINLDDSGEAFAIYEDNQMIVCGPKFDEEFTDLLALCADWGDRARRGLEQPK
jgi:hypothetical protein